MTIKRYLLTEAAFIGGALLAAGSRISDTDLPLAPLPGDPDGEPVRSKPPSSAIEINAAGVPVHDKDIARASEVSVPLTPTEIAPIAPHAPNPTAPQALPGHGVGEVAPAGQFIAADGVESDEAAEARGQQNDKLGAAVQRATKAAAK